MRKYLAIFLVLFLFLLLSAPVFASKREVLGIEDQNLSIPPTTEGPGIFLPDSPFFFLDQLKQSVRLFLAFTPEAKAKAYTSIAGERLAELRFMLDKKNLAGVKIDLDAISDSYKLAANQVLLAEMSGKDVTILAKDVNDSIKLKQKVLDELHIKAEGEVGSTVRAAADGLSIAKAKVENSLNEADLQNEIREDLLRETELKIHYATESAIDLKESLEDLEDEVTNAANKSLDRREEALRLAIAEKNEELRKTEQRKLELEKKQRNMVLEMQQKAVANANEIVEKAQETARRFEEIKSNNPGSTKTTEETNGALSSEKSSNSVEEVSSKENTSE